MKIFEKCLGPFFSFCRSGISNKDNALKLEEEYDTYEIPVSPKTYNRFERSGHTSDNMDDASEYYNTSKLQDNETDVKQPSVPFITPPPIFVNHSRTPAVEPKRIDKFDPQIAGEKTNLQKPLKSKTLIEELQESLRKRSEKKPKLCTNEEIENSETSKGLVLNKPSSFSDTVLKVMQAKVITESGLDETERKMIEHEENRINVPCFGDKETPTLPECMETDGYTESIITNFVANSYIPDLVREYMNDTDAVSQTITELNTESTSELKIEPHNMVGEGVKEEVKHFEGFKSQENTDLLSNHVANEDSADLCIQDSNSSSYKKMEDDLGESLRKLNDLLKNLEDYEIPKEDCMKRMQVNK